MLQLKHNVVGLTKALRTMNIPVVVTTTTEKMWGPLIPELAEALQDVAKIERAMVNAWTEKRVADAVKATGRKQVIVTRNIALRAGRFDGWRVRVVQRLSGAHSCSIPAQARRRTNLQTRQAR